ncbi:MAG: Unknown protein [uncultured Sulfurovum sp.]|uniref:Uncharacterized protein n=1 Tax=uncultured Sulfurovum sp. TaxID=269237 RepID=A0A6S6SKF3_9BACT|nr:MAG: Unknown protein [uncultured Sulfurovum sp.]
MSKKFQEYIKKYNIQEDDPIYGLAEVIFKMDQDNQILLDPDKAQQYIAAAFSKGVSSGIKNKLEVHMNDVTIDYDKLAEAILKKEKKRKFFFFNKD